MSVRNLDPLFQPKSIALIGASDRPRSLGATVMRNLLEGGFTGPIWPVNAKHLSALDLRHSSGPSPRNRSPHHLGRSP